MELIPGVGHETVRQNISNLIAKGFDPIEAVRFANAAVTRSTEDAARDRFYISAQLSDNISTTPEGYLLCEDVVIARTGEQSYLPDELGGMDDGGTGKITVTREPDEVFDQKAIKSFEGKPVTVGHPPQGEFLSPMNWKQLAVGIVFNVRRGTGDQASFLVADLLITDEQAIVLVSNGLREVSCGYDADYVQSSPGHAKQINIRGNHVALVDKGRCGGACSIQDEDTMATKPNAWERLLTAMGVKNGDELQQKLIQEEAGGAPPATPTNDGKTKDCECGSQATADSAVNQQILTALQGINEKLDQMGKPTRDADPEEPDESDPDGHAERMMKDGTADSFKELVDKLMKKGYSKEYATKVAGKVAKEKGDDSAKGTDAGNDLTEAEAAEKANTGKTYEGKKVGDYLPEAEILSPGIKVNDKETVEAFQRRTLDQAMQSGNKDAISGLLHGKTVDELTADELPTIFTAASQVVRHINNSMGMRSGVTTHDFGNQTSIESINEANRKFWAANGGAK